MDLELFLVTKKHYCNLYRNQTRYSKNIPNIPKIYPKCMDEDLYILCSSAQENLASHLIVSFFP